MENFVVSNSPFVRSGNDINKMFLYTALALIVPAVYGVVFFGLQAILVLLVSVGSCVLFELAYNLISSKKFILKDFSSLVTGLILGLTIPVSVPYWIVVVSAFVSIICVKIAFGGLGRNKFNPANVGRCFAGVAVSGLSGELYKLTLNGEILTSISAGGTNSIFNLFVGQSVGGIGTTCIVVILICFVFLVYTGVIDFKIPLFAILTFFFVSLALTDMDQAIMNICSGSFVFVSVFMLTDPNTSPDTFLGKFIYACGYGAISAVLWNIGTLGENTAFVVLLFVNIFVPFMDQYFVWKPVSLGGYRNAHKN
jgi:Na+-translocating ferredoxin:NAD+ oxidoreductase RnfD subunit